eukprot:TRINITY_DN1741_c0_g2_i1.p1 TRINITY_DN1741_c0_g2~~TRINITY_DN1741_c0_g2_i1.p1  ORF type:complete len:228 (-),score=59.03 TRINITY_DN1741_c0_g2_i1:49-732(-)
MKNVNKANPAKKLRSFINKNSSVTKANKVIFGVGSCFYKRSRSSIGLYLLDNMIQESGAEWTHKENIYSDVADLGEFIYIKPRGHSLKHNQQILSKIYNKMDLPPSDVILLHHDPSIQIGNIMDKVGQSIGLNDEQYYYPVDQIILDSTVPRICVGILPRDEDKVFDVQIYQNMRKFFDHHFLGTWYSNPFDEEDYKIIKEITFPKVKEKILGGKEIVNVYDSVNRF